ERPVRSDPCGWRLQPFRLRHGPPVDTIRQLPRRGLQYPAKETALMAAAPPRSHSGGRGRRRADDPEFVPCIDVMLVLLVIFMVTAPLLPPGAIDLPRAGRSSTRPDQYIEVQVRAAGDMRVRGVNTGDPSERRVARGDLAGAIEQLRGDNAQM